MLGYTRKLNHIRILKIRVLKYKYTNKHSDSLRETSEKEMQLEISLTVAFS